VRFTGRLGVPGLLLYLAIGLLLGWVLPGDSLIDPSLATVLGYAALVLILAHGGLTTPLAELRPVLGPSLLLATVGIAVSVAVVAIPLILLLDVDPQLAILLGAVLAATDAAAVFSVLRRINIAPRLKTMLEGES
jgi:cell volume regulation protein A